MKNPFTISLLAFFAVFFGACSGRISEVGAQTISNSEVKTDQNRKNESKTAVLVELFTSEGCSSCPPADRLLAKFEKEQPFNNIDVITLALHVDYWDSLGWKDEFSSPLFTRRQDIYAQTLKTGQTFTPQMIVDGRASFIGSKEEEARKAILANAKNSKAMIDVSFADDKLNIRISGIPDRERSTVYLAITEDKISTDVKGGENSGRKLEHGAVVRELRSIGMLSPEQSEFSYEQTVQILPNWNRENLKYVVFIQENQSRKILGASRVVAK
ncbi:MAG: DUF1223 domain-containing protein [Pyrinomonadaceae bacterium]|nr:DUF1223 domain-containing protein [Pyrinomonadaceae bacterium]